MLSGVGDDSRGVEAISILNGFGVDTSLVQCIGAAPTGSVSVTLDAAGKPTFEIHGDTAWDRVAWSDALAAVIEQADAVYFGTLGQRGSVSRATIRRALGLAKARSVIRVLDVNLRPPFFDESMIRESVALASIVKLSDDELREVASACGVPFSPDPLESLHTLRANFGLDYVVMTRGAQGALLVSKDGEVDQPGIPTTVVDTVGAGDSFTAAFVLGVLRGEDLRETLRNACQTASAVCAHAGAVPGGV